MVSLCDEIRVPVSVMTCKLMTPTERLIYSALPLIVEDGVVMSNEDVSLLLGVSRPTFTRSLRKFKRLGLLTTSFDGRRRIVRRVMV